ncbi:MAG: AAA family ATPase [Rhodobacteraceae bacterium]|jgi:pilus assembly protein CpaE|nr:AAA family ATPase [Paracoccaceae bacterium]
MSGKVALQAEPAPILACTISRDVRKFDLLIEDMETELGESWGDLSYDDARAFLTQPEASTLEFVAIALDDEDETALPAIAEVIKTATGRGIKVIVIAEDVSPIALHQLLKLGAEEFVPYPLPEGALRDAIERLRRPPAPDPVQTGRPTASGGGPARDGVVLPVHGMAGGVGSTTLAVNLAWELANLGGTGKDAKEGPRVLLMDLDLQMGSVSTFLDLPRREAVFELLSDTSTMDNDAFLQAITVYKDKLSVLTSPAEMIPLDLISSEDVKRLIERARANFDYVVIDMPHTVVSWTEAVLSAAHVYFAPLEIDMRSAQNTLRLVRLLKGEELPHEKMRYILNRAPGFTDLSGKARVKRLAESLDIAIEVQLPDGGRQIAQCGDHGSTLAEMAPKNPLRKEILKLAASLHALNKSAAEAG